MQRVSDHHAHVSVNAAGENMLPRTRRKPGAPLIVHPNRHDVVTRLHRLSDVKGEPGIATSVFADAPAIDRNFRHLKYAVEFETHAFARPHLRHVEMFPIPTVPDIKTVRGEVRHR